MAYAVTTTGARIGGILDSIDFNDTTLRSGGWTAAGAKNTALDTGDTITIINADGSKSALALVQDLLTAERGVVYMTGLGAFTYEERGSRARRTVPTAMANTVTNKQLGDSYTVTNKALTNNVATLTVGAHSIPTGATVTITGVDATFNGIAVVTATTSTTISYAVTAANVASTASSGTVVAQVATLTIGSHSVVAGTTVKVVNVDAALNGVVVVTSVTSTTIKYAKTGSTIASTAATGTVAVVVTSAALLSQPGFEFDQLINRQSVTRLDYTQPSPYTASGSTVQVGSNQVSMKLFGVSDGQPITTGYVNSDAAALSLGQYIANIRSTYVSPVTVQLDSADTTTMMMQLTTELQDRVEVYDQTSNTTGSYIVEGIAVEITNGGQSFVTTYTLSPYGSALPFILDSPTQGIFAPPDGTVTYSEVVSGVRPTDATYGAAGAWVLETDTSRYFQNTGTLASPVWTQTVFPVLTY
jgi:hypothetical protein